MSRTRRCILLLAPLVMLLAACSSSPSSSGAPQAGFPLTITNCGHEVTFDEPPQRIVLLESAPVSGLDRLGLLDRVVARAGAFPPSYYPDDVNATLARVPSLTEQTDATGHFQVSTEEILAQQPDLVMGVPDGISRDSIEATGVPVLEQSVKCAGEGEPATWQSMYDEIRVYGQVFDRMDAARRLAASLRDQVEGVRARAAQGPERRAAVLYPTVGGGSGYAYGAVSMAHPQLEAAGLTNVFADVDERVFEVSAEEVIARNPEVVVLLHVDGPPQQVRRAFLAQPGIGRVAALRNDAVRVQLYNFTEPSTPLSVQGLRGIVEQFG